MLYMRYDQKVQVHKNIYLNLANLIFRSLIGSAVMSLGLVRLRSVLDLPHCVRRPTLQLDFFIFGKWVKLKGGKSGVQLVKEECAGVTHSSVVAA